MTVSVKEVKNFLRVDHNEEDALIRSYIYVAEALCLDILRTEDRTILKSAKNHHGRAISTLQRSRQAVLTL